MILTDLQRHLRTEGRASLAQLSLRFDVEPEALRGMLGRLVAKRRVRQLPRPIRCAGCKICPDAALELYEWAGAPPTDAAPTCPIDLAPSEVRPDCRCGSSTPRPWRTADAARCATAETVFPGTLEERGLMTPLATAQAPIAAAQGCPYLSESRCSAVTFTAEKATAVTCSLQTGTYKDCPIYKTAPRG